LGRGIEREEDEENWEEWLEWIEELKCNTEEVEVEVLKLF
jgi:hypothetical protein